MGRGVAAWATNPIVLRVGTSKISTPTPLCVSVTSQWGCHGSHNSQRNASVSFTHDGRVPDAFVSPLVSSQIACAYEMYFFVVLVYSNVRRQHRGYRSPFLIFYLSSPLLILTLIRIIRILTLFFLNIRGPRLSGWVWHGYPLSLNSFSWLSIHLMSLPSPSPFLLLSGSAVLVSMRICKAIDIVWDTNLWTYPYVFDLDVSRSRHAPTWSIRDWGAPEIFGVDDRSAYNTKALVPSCQRHVVPVLDHTPC